jgi:hypothetical protein
LLADNLLPVRGKTTCSFCWAVPCDTTVTVGDRQLYRHRWIIINLGSRSCRDEKTTQCPDQCIAEWRDTSSFTATLPF